MLTKFYILCSYPAVHCVGQFDTIDGAREAFCTQYSGQTDEKNYYWTEADCSKHGRVELTAQSECQMCDQERAREEEQAIKDADAEFDARAIDGDPEFERQRYERCEREEFDRSFKRGLIAPRIVYRYNGRLNVGGEDDPRFGLFNKVCRVEAIEYLGACIVDVPDAFHKAWHKRDYAGMLEALAEKLGQEQLLRCLLMFTMAEIELYYQLHPDENIPLR